MYGVSGISATTTAAADDTELDRVMEVTLDDLPVENDHGIWNTGGHEQGHQPSRQQAQHLIPQRTGEATPKLPQEPFISVPYESYYIICFN